MNKIAFHKGYLSKEAGILGSIFSPFRTIGKGVAKLTEARGGAEAAEAAESAGMQKLLRQVHPELTKSTAPVKLTFRQSTENPDLVQITADSGQTRTMNWKKLPPDMRAKVQENMANVPGKAGTHGYTMKVTPSQLSSMRSAGLREASYNPEYSSLGKKVVGGTALGGGLLYGGSQLLPQDQAGNAPQVIKAPAAPTGMPVS